MGKKPNLSYQALGYSVRYNEKGKIVQEDHKPYVWYSQYTAGTYNSPSTRVCKAYQSTYATSGLCESRSWNKAYGNTYLMSYSMFFTTNGEASFISSWDGDGSFQENQRRLQSQQVNVAMVVRDLKDANKMALGYFRRVNDCIKYVKRRKWKRALNAFLGNRSKVKAAANNWLEFQFGVLPTIHSVQDAYRVVGQRLSSNNQLLRLSTSSQRVARMRTSTEGHKYYGMFNVKDEYLSLRYYSKKDTFNLLLNTNLVEAKWDMIPYSFLIDWFVPIGDYISQFGSLAHTTSDGCDTQRQTSIVDAYDERWTGDFLNSKSHYESVRVSTFRKVNRSIDYSMSFSELLNRSKLGISCNQAANAFALLAQRVPR